MLTRTFTNFPDGTFETQRTTAFKHSESARKKNYVTLVWYSNDMMLHYRFCYGAKYASSKVPSGRELPALPTHDEDSCRGVAVAGHLEGGLQEVPVGCLVHHHAVLPAARVEKSMPNQHRALNARAGVEI